LPQLKLPRENITIGVIKLRKLFVVEAVAVLLSIVKESDLLGVNLKLLQFAHLNTVLRTRTVTSAVSKSVNVLLKDMRLALLPGFTSLAHPLLLKFAPIAILKEVCALPSPLLTFIASTKALSIRRTRFSVTSLVSFWPVFVALHHVWVVSFGLTLSTALLFGKLDLPKLAIVVRSVGSASVSSVL
jgi:hypothetical protein